MEKRSGISIQTLAISAAASVAAAVVVPLFWERGTLVATALTPVVVALVTEALSRPAERIGAATAGVTRRSATGAAVRAPERFEPLPPGERDAAPEPREDDPFGLRSRPPLRHHWRLALLTGVAAFAVAVVALTASELVLGGPATKESGRTTFIAGGRDEDPEPSPTATPSATPEATETPETTPTPEPTATPTPAPTTTPAPLEATPTPTVTP